MAVKRCTHSLVPREVGSLGPRGPRGPRAPAAPRGGPVYLSWPHFASPSSAAARRSGSSGRSSRTCRGAARCRGGRQAAEQSAGCSGSSGGASGQAGCSSVPWPPSHPCLGHAPLDGDGQVAWLLRARGPARRAPRGALRGCWLVPLAGLLLLQHGNTGGQGRRTPQRREEPDGFAARFPDSPASSSAAAPQSSRPATC